MNFVAICCVQMLNPEPRTLNPYCSEDARSKEPEYEKQQNDGWYQEDLSPRRRGMTSGPTGLRERVGPAVRRCLPGNKALTAVMKRKVAADSRQNKSLLGLWKAPLFTHHESLSCLT